MCRIFFQGQGPRLISRKALEKCPVLASRLSTKSFFSNTLETINVEDIPYDIGIVIVHFLITGRYRCLDPKGDSEDEIKRSQLGTAFRVYAAATTFELTALKNVAQRVIASLESAMDLTMISRTLNETGLDLKEHPTLAMHVYSYIQLSMGVLSKVDMAWKIAELGFPESANVDSFEASLVSKGPVPKREEDKRSKSQPAPEQGVRGPSKGKNKALDTVTPVPSETDSTKPGTFQAWMKCFSKVQLPKPITRSQNVANDTNDSNFACKPVDEIMMPAQGLSEEAIRAARRSAPSAIDTTLDEGDLGLQVSFEVPPPGEHYSGLYPD